MEGADYDRKQIKTAWIVLYLSCFVFWIIVSIIAKMFLNVRECNSLGHPGCYTLLRMWLHFPLFFCILSSAENRRHIFVAAVNNKRPANAKGKTRNTEGRAGNAGAKQAGSRARTAGAGDKAASVKSRALVDHIPLPLGFLPEERDRWNPDLLPGSFAPSGCGAPPSVPPGLPCAGSCPPWHSDMPHPPAFL